MTIAPLSLGSQKEVLMARYPNAACQVFRPYLHNRDGTRRKISNVNTATLIWSGILQPTELSRKYTIEIRHIQGGFPRIFLKNPRLERRKEEMPPHIYNFKEGRICLYYPETDWSPDRPIADTIVPWAAEWLLHYEIWLATGTWQGEGIHPSTKGKTS